jgi:hypothetical protein
VRTIGAPGSWDDLFTDWNAWQAAGTPEGFVWGTCWSNAYPGLSYVEDSSRARNQSALPGHEMQETLIESDSVNVTLVFHDLLITQLAKSDPDTGALTPLD